MPDPHPKSHWLTISGCDPFTSTVKEVLQGNSDVHSGLWTTALHTSPIEKQTHPHILQHSFRKYPNSLMFTWKKSVPCFEQVATFKTTYRGTYFNSTKKGYIYLLYSFKIILLKTSFATTLKDSIISHVSASGNFSFSCSSVSNLILLTASSLEI